MADLTVFESDPELALFSDKITGIVAVCHENERPLQGLAGSLDWRFRGEISEYIRKGVVSGKIGECVYVPIRAHGKTRHIILLGAGYARSPGKRSALPDKSLTALKGNISKMRIERLGISQGDFGTKEAKYFKDHFKGIPICLVH